MNAIEIIKNELERQKITLVKLATDSGVGEKTLYRMLHGQDVKYSSVEKVLSALKISQIFKPNIARLKQVQAKKTSNAIRKKTATSPFLVKINYNIAKKVSMPLFVKTVKEAKPSWMIDKLFKEYDLTRLSELVRNTSIDYDDLAKAYTVSGYRADKFDRLFALAAKGQENV